MSAIGSEGSGVSRPTYDTLNEEAKRAATENKNNIGIAIEGNILLVRNHGKSGHIKQEIFDISELDQSAKSELDTRVANVSKRRDFEDVKNNFTIGNNKIKHLKTVKYSSLSMNSTKAKAQKELANAIAQMQPVNVTLNDGTVYNIPSGAIAKAGVNAEYVREAIQHGQNLLNQINEELRNLTANSPIGSPKDMADLMWALNAKAWKADQLYQSSSSSMYVSNPKICEALANAKDQKGQLCCYKRGGKNQSSHLKQFPESKNRNEFKLNLKLN